MGRRLYSLAFRRYYVAKCLFLAHLFHNVAGEALGYYRIYRGCNKLHFNSSV